LLSFTSKQKQRATQKTRVVELLIQTSVLSTRNNFKLGHVTMLHITMGKILGGGIFYE